MDLDARIRLWLDEDLEAQTGRPDEAEVGRPDDEINSDSEPDNVERDDYDSGSEQSADEDDGEPRVVGPQYIGRDNVTTWNIHRPNQRRRRQQRNILLHLPGVKAHARGATKVEEVWQLFFPDTVLEEITLHTNQRLNIIRQNHTRESDVVGTNIQEMKALIGLLYLAGRMRASHTNVVDLWDTDGTGVELFRLVMPYKRFYLLLRALRFDDAATRQVRRVQDKLAPIRSVFEGFVDRCKNNFTVGEYVTLDEMLECFRGRCSFRQFMPQKPAKYGLKMFAVVDSRMYYTSNLEVYCGKQQEGPFAVDNKPSSVVRRMVQPINGSGRNVTMDNWFAAIPTVEELAANNLTVVATLRKNKKELPVELVQTRKRPVNSSLFAFGENQTLVSYVPKKYRNVILVSSMHDSDAIDERTGEQAKPEIVTFYNETKNGVDGVDRMKTQYTVARVSLRWPLRLFYSLLDIGAINAQVILHCNTEKTILRRDFLKKLALELTKEHMTIRATSNGLKNDLRMQLKRKLNMPVENANLQPAHNKERIKCGFCPRKKNRLTTTRCIKCVVPICGEHTNTICGPCYGGNEDDTVSD